jgi:hypothetical protein
MSFFLNFLIFMKIFNFTKLKHIMQAKSRKGAAKEIRTEVHVASASLSPRSGLPYSHSIST